MLGLTLVTFTMILRIGIILGLRGDLTGDIDGYLGIAQQIADGNGFANPDTGQPTAFRPPLYPVLLSGWLAVGPLTIGVAILHVLLSAGTVWLTFATARRLGLSLVGATLAGGVVACDPLLARYAALPMTETLATFLAASLLYLSFGTSRLQQFLRGTAFGLAVLCRPTFWVFGGFAVIAWIIRTWGDQANEPHISLRNRIPWTTISVVCILVTPWMLRNWSVFSRPILMTTHGGYTLLLGNNPTFAREVVHQPFGTVWEGESLLRWQASLEDDMQAVGIATSDELDRDRYLRDRAIHFIRSEPTTFFQACWLRFRRFWGISPPESAVESVGRLWTRLGGPPDSVDMIKGGVRWSVRVFYLALFAAAVLGTFSKIHRPSWQPVFWLIISLMLVHLVYWSNARMRAPTLPAIALLAASVLRENQLSNRKTSPTHS